MHIYLGLLPLSKHSKIQKGTIPTPYLASFFTASPTIQEQRVKADYWDVWSSLFATHFFKLQADWCAANGVAILPILTKNMKCPHVLKLKEIISGI